MGAIGNELPTPARHGQNERAIALQRKNALFAGHDLGAENWAAIASLIETCKLNAINPQAYLTDVLQRVILRKLGEPVDDLTPVAWASAKQAAAREIIPKAA